MESLRKYFKKRNKNIVTLLGKQEESYTPKRFHKLRMEIKKLNALFNLLECCVKNFKRNKTFKPFKQIFKQAGKIREIQIERTILEEHFSENLLTEYRNYLFDTQRNEQKSFFEIAKDSFSKNIQKKNRKTTKLLLKTNKQKAKDYLDNQRISIEKMLHQKMLKKEHIHSLRRKLKMYQYNLESLNFKKRNKKSSKTDALSELLGKWHDYRVIVDHLKKTTASKTINTEERQKLESAKKAFAVKSHLLLDTINGIIPLSDFKRKADIKKIIASKPPQFSTHIFPRQSRRK